MTSKRKGDRGEDLAASYLQKLGYQIVKRNLRCRSGEVDIVVCKDDSLVFVEVKHWLTMSIHDLEHSITGAKRSRILGCAKEFGTKDPRWDEFRWRFDIIFVGPDAIRHFENAFTESGFQ